MSIIEPELSYKIVGFCMKIHGELGRNHKEKYYQRALEIDFIKNDIAYDEELKVYLEHGDSNIGYYCLDFLVDGRIIVELKSKPGISLSDIKQVLAYLETHKIKLGIIINFGGNSLETKRIVNSKYE